MQALGVFSKTTIANLAITKDLLDVPKRVLHLGSDAGFDLFDFLLLGIQLLSRARPSGNIPRDVAAVMELVSLLNAQVTGITEDALLFTVKQLIGRHNVMHISSRGVDAVNQPKFVVDTYVHFHTKVPGATFFSLVHLRIALAMFVFGRTRRRNDSGINNAAFAQH